MGTFLLVFYQVHLPESPFPESSHHLEVSHFLVRPGQFFLGSLLALITEGFDYICGQCQELLDLVHLLDVEC